MIQENPVKIQTFLFKNLMLKSSSAILPKYWSWEGAYRQEPHPAMTSTLNSNHKWKEVQHWPVALFTNMV